MQKCSLHINGVRVQKCSLHINGMRVQKFVVGDSHQDAHSIEGESRSKGAMVVNTVQKS